MKSLIIYSMYFFVEIPPEKQNMKNDFWVPEFGHQNWYTGLPNGLNMSMKNFFPFDCDNVE